MLTQCLPTYPSTSDMSCASWLRHFAAMLPHYAPRYELAELDVAGTQADATEFMGWLTRRILCATQAIQQSSPVAALPPAEAAEELAVPTAQRLLLARAAKLVQLIRAHRKYSIMDGVQLKLHLCPQHQLFAILPAPALCLVGHQTLDESVAIALRWVAYPEAVIDLEICRDGYTWHPPQLLAGDCHADIHPWPTGVVEWQYRARYRRPDWPVGPWGHVLAVALKRALLTQPFASQHPSHSIDCH